MRKTIFGRKLSVVLICILPLILAATLLPGGHWHGFLMVTLALMAAVATLRFKTTKDVRLLIPLTLLLLTFFLEIVLQPTPENIGWLDNIRLNRIARRESTYPVLGINVTESGDVRLSTGLRHGFLSGIGKDMVLRKRYGVWTIVSVSLWVS